MAFFILTRFVLVKYSHAFVERPSQGTSSRLTTVSLDYGHCNYAIITITITLTFFCTLPYLELTQHGACDWQKNIGQPRT